MNITCISFKPINQGFVLGYASIELPQVGMEIHGITLFQKDGKKWIGFPSKQYEKDGEKKYAPYFRIKDKAQYDQFNRDCITAIDKKRAEVGTNSQSYQARQQSFIPDGEIPF